MGNSINKVNYAEGVCNRKYCLQLHLFSRKSIVMGHVREECQHDLFYRLLHQ